MSWTSRQFSRVLFRTYDPVTNRVNKEQWVITKLQPSTRRQDLIGMRGLRDVIDCTAVSDDKFMMRFFCESPPIGLNDYWAIIDKFG